MTCQSPVLGLMQRVSLPISNTVFVVSNDSVGALDHLRPQPNCPHKETVMTAPSPVSTRRSFLAGSAAAGSLAILAAQLAGEADATASQSANQGNSTMGTTEGDAIAPSASTFRKRLSPTSAGASRRPNGPTASSWRTDLRGCSSRPCRSSRIIGRPSTTGARPKRG
jgi:hypothetical protein